MKMSIYYNLIQFYLIIAVLKMEKILFHGGILLVRVGLYLRIAYIKLVRWLSIGRLIWISQV